MSDYNYSKNSIRAEINIEEEIDEDGDNEDELVNPPLPRGSRAHTFRLQNEMGFMKLRRKSKGIRYRRYCIHLDRMNYFRVLIMLYLPWRNEEVDVENVNCEQIFNENKDVIDINFKLYNANNSVDLDVENELANAIAFVEEIANIEDPNENSQSENNDFNPSTYNESVIQPDIVRDIIGEEVPIDIRRKFPVPKIFTAEQLNDLYSTLNEKQHQICIDILNRFKRNTDIPFHYFISGGAGVGKSRLITAIYQSVTSFFRNYRDVSLELPCVLLVAPTGKASHNIDGITAHQAFSLVVNQSESKSGRLSDDIANTLQMQLSNVKLIVIDEISMVSFNQLNNINSRLRQIFKSNQGFGNIPVLVLMDFNQLSPIGRFIFKPPILRNTTNDILETVDSNPLWEKFKMMQLNQIMRQRDDAEFARALSRFANGKHQIFKTSFKFF